VTGKFLGDHVVRKRCNVKYLSDREFTRGNERRVLSIHVVRRRCDEIFQATALVGKVVLEEFLLITEEVFGNKWLGNKYTASAW
jgi:hypothetical protein